MTTLKSFAFGTQASEYNVDNIIDNSNAIRVQAVYSVDEQQQKAVVHECTHHPPVLHRRIAGRDISLYQAHYPRAPVRAGGGLRLGHLWRTPAGSGASGA